MPTINGKFRETSRHEPYFDSVQYDAEQQGPHRAFTFTGENTSLITPPAPASEDSLQALVEHYGCDKR